MTFSNDKLDEITEMCRDYTRFNDTFDHIDMIFGCKYDYDLDKPEYAKMRGSFHKMQDALIEEIVQKTLRAFDEEPDENNSPT